MAQKIRKGKRRWYPIVAPSIFQGQHIGETFVYETETIPHKHITVNLMTLMNNPKKQNMNVFFRVTELKDGVAQTKVRGIEMMQSAAKRLVRRGRSKVSDSFRAKTKKGQIVRVKPIIMTRTRVEKETQRAIRAKARELLREALQKYSFDTIISDIANNRLQKHLRDQLSGLHPVRSADIRSLRYEAVDNEAEDEFEESEYETRPKREKPKKEDGLSSLKADLEEELAAEKGELEPEEPPKKKAAKKPKKKAAPKDDEEEDSEDEESEKPKKATKKAEKAEDSSADDK